MIASRRLNFNFGFQLAAGHARAPDRPLPDRPCVLLTT